MQRNRIIRRAWALLIATTVLAAILTWTGVSWGATDSRLTCHRLSGGNGLVQVRNVRRHTRCYPAMQYSDDGVILARQNNWYFHNGTHYFRLADHLKGNARGKGTPWRCHLTVSINWHHRIGTITGTCIRRHNWRSRLWNYGYYDLEATS